MGGRCPSAEGSVPAGLPPVPRWRIFRLAKFWRCTRFMVGGFSRVRGHMVPRLGESVRGLAAGRAADGRRCAPYPLIQLDDIQRAQRIVEGSPTVTDRAMTISRCGSSPSGKTWLPTSVNPNFR